LTNVSRVILAGLSAAALIAAAGSCAEARCSDHDLRALQAARIHSLAILATRPVQAKEITVDTAWRQRSCALGEPDRTAAAKLQISAIDTDGVLARALSHLGNRLQSEGVIRVDIAELDRIKRETRVGRDVRTEAGRYADRLRAILPAPQGH
jgi:hypothetical protein